MDRLGVDRRAERERGQDRELVGGVEAADVERRIGFGIAEALRFLEAILEGQALQLHARQDVIAGAVEDAVDAADLVAGEAFAQRLHDRDAAGDGGLERERHALLLGELRERHAVLGEQRLVGGDDRLARRQRRLDRLARRAVGAADEFDEEIDVGRARQGDGIVEPFGIADDRRRGRATCRGPNGGHRDRAPRARRKRLRLPVEKTYDGSADRAETGNADAQ